MNQSLKKRILISPEQKIAPIGAFFQELGMELCDVYDKGLDYQFIVDDFLPEIAGIPRLQSKKTISSDLEPFVRASFDESMLQEIPIKNLMSSYFSEALERDLIDRYSNNFKDLFTIKIHDYLNVGFFVDSIVVEAYKNQFDIDQIRSYLNFSLTHALKMVEQQEEKLPLDVSFSCSETAFVVQISFNALYVDAKKDMASFGEFSSMTNFFDLSYYQKRERVSYSSLWFKESKLKTFKSCFFTEMTNRKKGDGDTVDVKNWLDESPEQVQYETKIDGLGPSRKLHLARKFSLFIKNYRSNEESPTDISTLMVEDIDDYLSHYPRKEALLEIDLEIKNFIIKLLKDDQLYEGVSEYVQKIAQSNLDSHVEEIQRVLGEKSLEDISEIIRVKRGKADEGEVSVVSGWTEGQNEEEWKIKRSALVKEIKEEVAVLKSQGHNVIENDIIRIVSEKLEADPEDVKTVVKGIVEEVLTSDLSQKEKFEEALAKHLLPPSRPEQEKGREKSEEQIVRMKRVIEQMKNEIIKLRSNAENSSDTDSSVSAKENYLENLKLKKALSRSLEMFKSKEKFAAKQKADFEQILQAKEEKAQLLENRIAQMKNEYSFSREFANEEKLEQLEAENKGLAARLELANRKINIISENMNKQENDSTSKKEKELLALKGNMQMAQALIEKFKQERNDLENKLAEEKEKFLSLKNEKGANGDAEKEQERESQLIALATEKKGLEEKGKLQAIEIKKMEQKLKFTVSKLEEAQKRKVAPAAIAKSIESYVKQLENANLRLNEANNEVAEKRKETVKLKQENALLTSKLAEIEKKLGNSEKKAA